MNHRNPLSPPVFPFPWASEWGEDRYGLWQALTYKNFRHAFRWIAPGSFMMGSPGNEAGRYVGEDLHSVTLGQGFWLAETTVTQALWQAIKSDNPSEFKGDNRPVENVSWEDAQTFIRQMNQVHPDLTVRLPWEAEWEYACRAGTQTPFNFDGELSLEKANYRGTWEIETDKWGKGAKQETAAVFSYPCNDWGLFEMHGNVWEWCEDAWLESLGKEAVPDPWQQQAETGSIARRVVRGGSWIYYGRDCRAAHRFRYAPDDRYSFLGFRLALGHAGTSPAVTGIE